MLEGYEPIDFSSLGLGQSTRNRIGLSQTAMNILANSQWKSTPMSTFLAEGLSSTGEVKPKQQTLWGRVVDLLSAPAYGVANAADDALAGHQSSDTDSVIEDIGKTVGGIFTGGMRGSAAGLRGAFMPSEEAARPDDKIYLGDFLVRWDTHMSAEDAMNPENREEVRRRLMDKKINMFSDDPKDKYFYNFDTGQVQVSDEDIEDYFEDMKLYGLGASMIADPINFIAGPAKATRVTAEVPEVISGSKNTYDGFKVAPKTSESTGVNSIVRTPTLGRAAGSYRVELPTGAVQNKVATPNGLTMVPDWFSFPSSAAAMQVTRTTRPVDNIVNELDPLDDILGQWASGRGTKAVETKDIIPARVPDEQLKLAEALSKKSIKYTTELMNALLRGNSEATMKRMFPGMADKLTQTNRFIKHISGVPNLAQRMAISSERKKLADAFGRVIKADSEALKKPNIVPAQQILNDAEAAGISATTNLVESARPVVQSKNPARDAKIVNDTVVKFSPQLSLNEIPAGITNPASYRAAMQSHGTLTGPKQANVWNYLTSVALKDIPPAKRFSVAVNILRQVEDKFIEMGHVPMSATPKAGNSARLRLSQVIDAIGPSAAALNPSLLTKILRGDSEALKQLPAEVVQKIEELKAAESLVDAPSVIRGVDAASKDIENLLKGPLSAARQEEIVTIGSRAADDIARMSGGSPAAGVTAARAIRDEFAPKSPVDSAVNSARLNTSALISHPDVSSRLLAKYSSTPSVTRAINKTIGGPPPSALRNLVGHRALVPEWLGARFNAAYKNADMRPIYLRNAASAKSTVAKRAEHLNELAKTYNINDRELWSTALQGAQGKIPPVAGTQAADLAQEIQKTMENLFGSSGLKKGMAETNTVVGRSQLFMNELNKNLRRFGLGKYKFTKDAETGQWLNSWEKWDITDEIGFLFRMQNVVEHTVREKIMFDEIGSRFGTTVKGGEFTHKVNHPRLAHLYFGANAAEQATTFINNLKKISQPASKEMQMFDKALSKWKAAVTIYVPSHHMRNLIGDVYFNWLGGVNSSRAYGSALKVMRSQKERYPDLAALDNLTDPENLRKAIQGTLSSTGAGNQIALTLKNGRHITNDEVYVTAFQQGILPTTRVLEDIPDDAITALDKFRPLKGKGQQAAHTISEGRDHYVRLAHYIDALKKSNKGFEGAIEEAAAVVRKWHPDGMDLTAFERNVMRRMFPFYSWTRKALPLVVESIVATPGKVMAYPKAQYMLQNMMGIETGPMSDPFPVDQLFPDWLREKGIGPAFSPESGVTSVLGGIPGYSVINPGNPTLDTVAQLNNPGKMAMGMINPAVRIPIELSTGRDTQSGAPVDGTTDTDYWIKQIPGLSHAGRVTGEFGTSDTVKETSQGYNMQNILNLLFALGAQNSGPYQKSAEFDLREFLRNR